jgi:PAS domain S-box-containing protein
MRTAADLMTPNPKMVQSGASLQEVIELFLDQGITSSPVVNPLGEILGVLSELSLVKAYMIHKAKLHKNDRVGHHIDLLDPVAYVNMHAPIIDVLKEMIWAPTHRLLVKGDKEKIVGIISPKDLMRAMIGKVNPAQNLKEKLIETESKLKESLEKLEETEKHLLVYKNVFHEVPYMMHAVDAEGKILMANKREHDVLGYQDGELVGKTIYDLYAKSMHHEAIQGLKRVMEAGHHHMTYTTLLSKTGASIRCDIASSAIRNKHGEFISTISVLRPVDSDEMLRILNGIVNDSSGPLAKYFVKS